MSLKLKELNEKRGAKVKQARSIISEAETAARELTADERSRVSALHAEVETLDADIGINIRQLAAESGKGPQLSRQEQRDVGRFEIHKVLRHMLDTANGASVQALDGVEAEMVTEGKREARASDIRHAGLMLPRMVVRRGDRNGVEFRDMTATGTTSVAGDQGGMTIATEKRGLLDDFFNASIMRGLGSTVLEGLVGNLDLPRLTAGTDPAKKAENATADEVSPTTAMLSLSPKRLPAYIDISERLLNQSSVAIEAILRNHLTTQMGAIREKSFWHGGGTNEPVGIAGTAGIGSVAGGTNGAAPTRAHLIALQGAVDAQNARLGSLGYASNGQIREKLMNTPRQASGVEGNFIINESAMNVLMGYNAAYSNAISRTLTKGSASGVCSAIFFGNFADFYEAYWGGVSLEIVRDKTNAISGLYTLVASTYYDGGVVRPKSFAAMLDALGA